MIEVFKNAVLNKISEELIADNLVTKEQLDKAVRDQDISQTWIDILTSKGVITDEKLLEYLQKHQINVVNPSDTLVDPQLMKLFPLEISQQFRFLPLYELDNKIFIATPDLDNVPAIDYVKSKLKKDLELLYCTQSQLEAALDNHYKSGEEIPEDINESLKEFNEELIDTSFEDEEETVDDTMAVQELQIQATEAPIVRMVNLIIAQSINQNASDIHVGPQEHDLFIRHRIDGILHDLTVIPKRIEKAFISRLKIMSGMDIAERRAPQDGRFKVKLASKYFDMRCSIYPTQYGENMVLRILRRDTAMVKLGELGFLKPMLKTWTYFLHTTGKILLVTGPTGSGKTTTLYGSLNEINHPSVNIMTIEDPIEYSLPLIRQAQVSAKAGLTFSTGLRTILRQDPDIIMVGEIRDEETARIAVQSALTGHLVFSTLHTNNAVGSISRLVDMGVEPFLIASSVASVLAQRLVRLICTSCKTKTDISPELKKKFEDANYPSITKAFIGKGCKECHGTGYKGRILIAELLSINAKIRELIIASAGDEEIKKAAFESGMASLRHDGLAKVMTGMTTIDEVIRVTPEEE